MKTRENISSLLRRTGYGFAPATFEMCPSLYEKYKAFCRTEQSHHDFFNLPIRYASGGKWETHPEAVYHKYFQNIDDRLYIDRWGCGHQKGSEAAAHMTYLISPMRGFTDVKQILDYPFPSVDNFYTEGLKAEFDALKARDLYAAAPLECTVWEQAWYLRGMEELMADMVDDDEMAHVILDIITQKSSQMAEAYARAGAEIIMLGDDIGMQSRIMMSEAMYRKWIKPRQQRVIAAAKNANPDVLIRYHSCGFVEPFIPDLIEIGVDVLNPVQPESMDFAKLHKMYGDKISFFGTLGTQTTMPFGTPDDVRNVVKGNLDIAGKKGGLIVCPTHLLEPEVPFENVMAYVEACKNYKP